MPNTSVTDSCGMFQCSYFSTEAHIGIIITYIAATLINFFANSLVWKAVIKNRRLRTSTNYLLLNLSLADIVSGILIYPYLFIVDIGKIFYKPREQALLCNIAQGLSLFFVASGASLIILCGISYNRFMGVKYPMKRHLQMTRKSAIIFSILAWVSSTVFMLPNMLSFKYEPEIKACTHEWGQINAKVYRICLLLAGTVLPTIFLLLSYMAIVYRARRIARTLSTASNGEPQTGTGLKRAERMVGVLIFVYVICWLPFSLQWTLKVFTNFFPQTIEGQMKLNRWVRMTVFFCTLNGTINPIVYIFGISEINQSIRRSSNRTSSLSLSRMKAFDEKMTIPSP